MDMKGGRSKNPFYSKDVASQVHHEQNCKEKFSSHFLHEHNNKNPNIDKNHIFQILGTKVACNWAMFELFGVDIVAVHLEQFPF